MPGHTPERIAEIRAHLAELHRTRTPAADFARQIGVAAWTHDQRCLAVDLANETQPKTDTRLPA